MISKEMVCVEDGPLVCENGIWKDARKEFLTKRLDFPILDYSGKLIMPGRIDLYVHVPQYSFRGMGWIWNS